MPDSKYIRIDSVQETDQVYLEITKIFGKEIFAEPYRCVGAFLDIAPKMTEEANYLMKAFSEHVPQDMAAAGSMSKETAQQLFAYLSDGFPSKTLLEAAMPPYTVLPRDENKRLLSSSKV